MGGTQTTDNEGKGKDTTNSNTMCMKLIQLWLTSFAIGIPTFRLLQFFNFRVIFFELFTFELSVYFTDL